MSSNEVLDYGAIYPKGGPEYIGANGLERGISCPSPDHPDKVESASVNLESGVWYCHGCGASGTAEDYLRLSNQQPIYADADVKKGEPPKYVKRDCVPTEDVDTFHRNLLLNPEIVQYLVDRRGWSKQVIQKYKIGYDPNNRRIMIPIFRGSDVINIRCYYPWSDRGDLPKFLNYTSVDTIVHDGRKYRVKVKYPPGYLFPMSSLEEEDILLCAGEPDALCAISHGFNAITYTRGETGWHDSINECFRGKNVVVIYDSDDAGREGAAKVVKNLATVAASIKNVVLPFPPSSKKDITDYFVDTKGTKRDLTLRIKAHSAVSITPGSLGGSDKKEETQEVDLDRASESQYAGKTVQIPVLISAKSLEPYIIASEVEVRCDLGHKKLCKGCIVNLRGDNGKIRREVMPTTEHLLEIIDAPKSKQREILCRSIGVPVKCKRFKMKTTSFRNVEEIRMFPQLNRYGDGEYVTRRGYYIGHGIRTNRNHIVEAKTLPHPDDQTAVHIITKATPSVDRLESFKLSDADAEDLKVFQVPEGSTVQNHLRYIYNDLTANVTRLFERDAMHLFADLVFHSVLFINFQNERIKGYADALLIGDSSQGKSKMTEEMLRHYQVGARAVCKEATRSGLIGGQKEAASRRSWIEWGVIPLNDRRLVVLDEVKGMSTEIVATLTDVRSSGFAEITGIQRWKTHARTRLLWISNPRTSRTMSSYNYGVDAVRSLIGNLEDIRRFDMIMPVATGEVSEEILNRREEDLPKVNHVFTSQKCRNLILWAWSRKMEQIKFSPAAVDLILQSATDLGRTFDSSFPLAEPADLRYKLARLSAALAARVYSTKDGEILNVETEHVAFVVRFLKQIYCSDLMGFQAYSEYRKKEKTIAPVDAEEIKVEFSRLDHPEDVIEWLLSHDMFGINDLLSVTQEHRDNLRHFIGLLTRKSCLQTSTRGKYFKTPKFISLLRTFKKDGVLSGGVTSDEEEMLF